MATDITLRATKGSALTHAEGDQNFESLSYTVDSKTSDYSVLYTDQNKIIVFNNTDLTATLPTLSAANGTDTDSWKVVIKNIHSTDLTIEGDGTETIEGDLNIVIPQWGCITFFLDSGATEWNIKDYTTTYARVDLANTFAAAQTFSAAATFSDDLSIAKTLTQKVGSDAASATALTLGDGNLFDVTGTTAITSLATKGIGLKVTLQFDGIFVLTHHATNLILPSAANITTAVGDIATFYEYASGDWRCISYTRANGRSIEPGDVKESDIEWANAGGISQQYVYRTGNIPGTPFADFYTMKVEIPGTANQLKYEAEIYASTPATANFRLESPTATGTTISTTSTTAVWVTGGTLDISGDSGFTSITVRGNTSSAAAGPAYLISFHFRIN